VPYPAIAVANYFLDLAESDGKILNPMKIQKLIYFAHGWHLAVSDSPLIAEKIMAWKYGPVIPVLYQAFKKYGSGPIETHAGGPLEPDITDYSDETSAWVAHVVMKGVWETFGDLGAIQLSAITHEQGSPWYKTMMANPNRLNSQIPNGLIADYFSTRIPANVTNAI